MTSFIDKANRWLIHRYPNIWNTRLVWMLLIAIAIHLLFFVGGLFSLQNVERFHYYLNDGSLIGNSGLGLFSAIVSVIILVIWIVVLLKNNAFKSFYPFSAGKLFLSFWYFFLIFLTSTTFYLSYALGYKVRVNQNYPIAEQLADIHTANKASIFFNFNLTDYSLGNRNYPAPFDTLYCESSLAAIDESKPIYYTESRKFQFWSVKKVVLSADSAMNHRNTDAELNRQMLPNGQVEISYKDQIVSLADTPPATYNYFNYSLTPFSNIPSYYTREISTKPETDEGRQMIAQWHQILNNKDRQAIENIIDSFLMVAHKYKIKTSLTKATWMDIIFENEDFKVTKFIQQGDRVYMNPDDTTPVDAYATEPATEVDATITAAENTYYMTGLTQHYLDQTALTNTFESIQSIRKYDFVKNAYEVHLMLALGLSLLLLMYRATSLKTMIFSIVAGGVLSIFTILILMLYNMGNYSESSSLVSSYIVLFIASGVLVLPFFIRKDLGKMVRGIHINLVLAFSIFFALLLLMIVDLHMESAYEARHFGTAIAGDYSSLFREYSELIFWGSLIYGLVFTGIFCKYIRSWKGSAEA